jgi:predicted dehydrogenase
VDTVKKTGVTYVLAEQTRYWDFMRRWRKMAKQGDFGKIVYAEGAYLHYEPEWDLFVDNDTGRSIVTSDAAYHGDPKYRQSWRYKVFAEPILYLPHTLSPLLSVTGGRISKVCCFGTRSGGYSYEGFQVRDLQEAAMYNTEDIVFSVKAGFTTPHGRNPLTGAHWYQIKGTKSSVEIPRSADDCGKLWRQTSGWENADWSCVPDDADEAMRNISHGGADMEPILQFVRAILGIAAPEMDVFAAVETAAPAILAAKSCENGGVMLEVPDFRI